MEQTEYQKRAEVCATVLTRYGAGPYREELQDAIEGGAHLRTLVEAIRAALKRLRHEEVLVEGKYQQDSPNRLTQSMEPRQISLKVKRVRGWGVSGKGSPSQMDELMIHRDGHLTMLPFSEGAVEGYRRLVEKSPNALPGK